MLVARLGAARVMIIPIAEKPQHIRDLFRDLSPPIRGFCPALSAFRSRRWKLAAYENRCVSRALRPEISPGPEVSPTSGSSDAPALQVRSPARSSPPPRAYGTSRRGG